MSTPTVVRRIWSSISRLRLTLLKKILPPASSLMRSRGLLRRRGDVPARVHAVRHAALLQRLRVFPADERVLHPVGNGSSALGNVDRGVVGVFLARRAGVAAGVVRAEPGGEAERVLGHAEVLVVPARAAGGRRPHADRLVVDALPLAGTPVLPPRHVHALGPSGAAG